MARYQDVYPEAPLLDSAALARAAAADLLTLEYFEAEPATMPEEIFDQHHVLLNLREEPQDVENVRDGVLHKRLLKQNDIVVTPAGVRSGWRWFVRSKVVIVTLDPAKLARFGERELGLLLTDAQLRDLPQFEDADICAAGVMLRDALASRDLGSEVMFESLARVFLVKLLQRYGDRREEAAFNRRFTAAHYKRVLDYVADHFGGQISLEALAAEAGLSESQFSRVFRETIGATPMRFVTEFRVEQAKAMLADPARTIADVAHACGFADQAHLTRVFKQIAGETPSAWRRTRGASA
ncbi:MAG: AraC family transcriptional regulator [Pseudomonadota bacterium]